MVRNNITRWSPDTCGCVIEMVTVYDDNNNRIDGEEPKFLLMNEVCDKHKHLASTTHRENHEQLSKTVLDYIEEAKTSNMKQVDDQIANATRHHIRRQLVKNKQIVADFNNEITEEWKELVSFPHAFDSHIHEQVMKENRAKNGQ